MEAEEIREELLRRGFARVCVLDGEEAGIGSRRLILCIMPYRACAGEGNGEAAGVIHPYYPASQRAYRTAREAAAEMAEKGIRVRLANDIRVKRILNRLPFLKRGRNTLSYLPETGSRFHVQILACDEEIPVTDRLETAEHEVMCLSCRRCAEACPGGAIREDGFEKERCLRWWMLNGKCPPEAIMRKMGNRLIGCDACESCCPHNAPGAGEPPAAPLRELLAGGDREALAGMIGSNYARKNRILIQACAIAASRGRKELLPEIRALEAAESPEVRAAARQAVRILTEGTEKENETQGEKDR